MQTDEAPISKILGASDASVCGEERVDRRADGEHNRTARDNCGQIPTPKLLRSAA